MYLICRVIVQDKSYINLYSKRDELNAFNNG